MPSEHSLLLRHGPWGQLSTLGEGRVMAERYHVIGDVHGCLDMLTRLLEELGYQPTPGGSWAHPEGYRLVFVGDLVARGPASIDCLLLARDLAYRSGALAVMGNNELKLVKLLEHELGVGPALSKISRGLARVIPELQSRRELLGALLDFVLDLPHMLALDGGKLVVVHAAYCDNLHRLPLAQQRALCVCGPESAGLVRELGTGQGWTSRYTGEALVVWGHLPHRKPTRAGNTYNIEQGCSLGGALTAYEHPTGRVVQVSSNGYDWRKDPEAIRASQIFRGKRQA